MDSCETCKRISDDLDKKVTSMTAKLTSLKNLLRLAKIAKKNNNVFLQAESSIMVICSKFEKPITPARTLILIPS